MKNHQKMTMISRNNYQKVVNQNNQKNNQKINFNFKTYNLHKDKINKIEEEVIKGYIDQSQSINFITRFKNKQILI